MKLGLVTPAWPGHNTPNGITTAVYHLAMGLKEDGHEPVIVAMNIDGPPPPGIPVVRVKMRPWSFVEKVRRRLGALSVPDEVHGENLADAMDAAMAQHALDAIVVEETRGWALSMIRRGTVPVVVFLHGPWLLHRELQTYGDASDDKIRLTREAKTFPAAKALISPSQNVLDSLERAVSVEHVPRTVIPNSFTAGPMPVHTDVGAILFVGRYDRHKGGDTVIAAFDRVAARHPEARLTFVGPDAGLHRDDGSVQSIETALAALPVDRRERLIWLGSQSTEQVAALRRTHAIVVLASRFENFNYTMLEALAAGQAIVATNVGGQAEVLEDNKTALMIPPDDPDAMADALDRLLEYPDLARSLGRAARARLDADFAPRVVAARVVDFLQSVL